MKNFDYKKKDGFVILLAVVISSLLLSLGAFIANIAVKEIALSSSGRESQAAFYAADAAIECALYQDLRVLPFAASSTAPGPANVSCYSNISPITSLSGDSDTGITLFRINFANTPAQYADAPYAWVQVTKDQIGTFNDLTTIEALGYNTFNQNSTRRVERALKVSY